MAAMSDLMSARQVVEAATEGIDPLSKEWIEAMLTAAGLQEHAPVLLAQGVTSRDHLHDLPPYETLTKTPFKMTVVAANRLTRFAHAVHAESAPSGKNNISGITSYVVCDPVWKTSLLKLITCIKNQKN